MNEDERLQCKVLAFLLEYPAPPWLEDLTKLNEVVQAVCDQKRRQLLQNFLSYAGSTPAIELQAIYTSAFDLDSTTSLHLTYHLMGDSEDRGKALAELLWMYHREGFDAAIGELPDYLPMMLEFLANVRNRRAPPSSGPASAHWPLSPNGWNTRNTPMRHWWDWRLRSFSRIWISPPPA